MNKPRALRPGDRIAVVAPASNSTRDELDRGVAELVRLGYDPVYSDALFERGWLSAGPGELRARDFMRAWSDPSIGALIALRGGYGSVELLPHLVAAEVRQSPKLFIGYSDMTTVLAWLTTTCGVTALHGPMLEHRLSNGGAGYDERSFRALLQGGEGLRLAPDGLDVLRPGSRSGPLLGGTLTLLAASLGTPYAFDPPPGSVLFIEDVGERPYRLHRMLTQLRLSGVIDRAGALVFGEMRGCDEPSGDVTARQVIGAFTEAFEGPVVYGFPSGHTQGPCWTLPFGVAVRVETSPHPCLVVEESPVA